jgi:predicted TIM-barrel fold metal-dependent hydrolase
MAVVHRRQRRRPAHSLYQPENVLHLCLRIGADHVVFGTDYPLAGGRRVISGPKTPNS